MVFYLMLAVFGLLSGITSVLFGFGGGFVVVPLLYRALLMQHGWDPIGQSAMHIAVATSTCLMVVTASLATRRHAALGNIVWPALWPIAAFIAVGAVLGAMAATWADGQWLRWAFVVYLVVTIADCLFREGFMSAIAVDSPAPKWPLWKTGWAGTMVGIIAALLGVGGSVMTVPMMRRRGWDMKRATAMANPLTLPVALCGTFGYLVFSQASGPSLGAGFIGNVDLLAFVGLAVGSLIGVQCAAPLVGIISDRWHARIYVALLVIVALGMAL